MLDLCVCFPPHGIIPRTIEISDYHFVLHFTGDIVGLRPSKGPAAEMVSGVVTSVAPSSLSVAFDAVADGTVDLDGDAQYTVAKLANDVTYKRLKRYAMLRCSF